MTTTQELTVSTLLKDLGITPGILGYEYLKAAIGLQLEDRKYRTDITKVLYPEIARMYNTSPSAVERSIRHAIEKGWLICSIDVAFELFRYSVSSNASKPTNSEFIATVVEYIRLHSQEKTYGDKQ